MAARRSSSFLRWLSSQEAFEGSNGIEEFVCTHLLQRTFDFDLFGTQCGDRFDISLGLGLATLSDGLFAVLLEVIGQGVQEVLGEAIASTDGLTTGVGIVSRLERLEVVEGIGHSRFLRGVSSPFASRNGFLSGTGNNSGLGAWATLKRAWNQWCFDLHIESKTMFFMDFFGHLFQLNTRVEHQAASL